MKRNRAQTEQRLMDAAVSLIVETGFTDFGVNHIAARAGVDKALIYRYFGGLDGMLERIGRSTALFPDAGEMPLKDTPAFIEAYRLSLMENPLTAALLDWCRLIENPLTQAFHRQRRTFWDEVRDRMRPDPAMNALLDLLAVLPVNAFSADTLAPLLTSMAESEAPGGIPKELIGTYPSSEEDLPTNLL